MIQDGAPDGESAAQGDGGQDDDAAVTGSKNDEPQGVSGEVEQAQETCAGGAGNEGLAQQTEKEKEEEEWERRAQREEDKKRQVQRPFSYLLRFDKMRVGAVVRVGVLSSNADPVSEQRALEQHGTPHAPDDERAWKYESNWNDRRGVGQVWSGAWNACCVRWLPRKGVADKERRLVAIIDILSVTPCPNAPIVCYTAKHCAGLRHSPPKALEGSSAGDGL